MNRSDARWVRALAPAKINPYLAVLGRRADGFHEVDTTLAAIGLCDVVAVRRRNEPGIALEVVGPEASADVPRDERNLVVRAARAALEHAPRWRRGPGGLELRLEKHVPSQAGLGGGSSDAAAAWLACATLLGGGGGDALALFHVAVDEQAGTRELAALGSDCAFFWSARETGYARCRGRGELVEPLPRLRSKRWLVIATPARGAPTAAVYQAFANARGTPETAPALVPEALEAATAVARASLFNHLERAALLAVPELAPWRRALDESDLDHFRLSGSGSSFFGLFEAREAAEAASARVIEECARRSLALRGARITSFAGHGARLVP